MIPAHSLRAAARRAGRTVQASQAVDVVRVLPAGKMMRPQDDRPGSVRRDVADVEDDRRAAAQIQALRAQLQAAQAALRAERDRADAAVADLARLTSDTLMLAPSAAASSAEVEDLRAKLAAEQSARRELETECQALREECAKLEAKVNMGAFNPEHTRVLHLARPPLQAKHELDLAAARAENAQLQAKLVELTQASADAAALDELRRTNARLTEKLEDANKRELRFKDVFREKIHQFRETILALTGYRVEMVGQQGQVAYRLTHMYTDRSNELLFAEAGGRLSLVRTPFADQLQPLIERDLAELDSVPLFLAHLTLELYRQRQAE